MNQVAATIRYKCIPLEFTGPSIPIINRNSCCSRKVSRRPASSLNWPFHLPGNTPACPYYPPWFIWTFSKYRSGTPINRDINEGRRWNKIRIISNVSTVIHNLLNMTAITTNKLSSHCIKIHSVLRSSSLQPKFISTGVKRKIRAHK